MLKKIFIFILLTLLTQVGGIIYLAYQPISKFIKKNGQGKQQLLVRFIFFLLLYLFITLIIIPPIAKQFGRTPMPALSTNKTPVRPLNLLTVLLNRHYVEPRLEGKIIEVARILQKEFPNTSINYLDANFPFMDGFPLLPHLSHDDGEKLDVAFFYKDQQTGKVLQNSPSWIGYGVCEEPRKGELNQPNICHKKGHWQYGFLEKIIPQWHKEKMVVDAQRTKRLLQLLAKNKGIKKIFIEPHLKTRWGLKQHGKIRYHGCHAVRHDDHIHVQL